MMYKAGGQYGVTKLTKTDKCKFGDIKLFHLCEKYEIRVIENKKDYAVFILGNKIHGEKTYIFNKAKSQIKGENDKEFTGKIIHRFKQDFKFIPERSTPMENLQLDKTKKEKIQESYLNWLKEVNIGDITNQWDKDFIISTKEIYSLSEKQIQILINIKKKTDKI